MKYPACGKWLGYLILYVNREVEWSTQPDSNGFVTPLNEDFDIGDSTNQETSGEAEAASAGRYVDVPLHKGDLVWLLPPDARGTYVDNAGGMTLEVTVIAPLS